MYSMNGDDYDVLSPVAFGDAFDFTESGYLTIFHISFQMFFPTSGLSYS